MAKLKSFIKIEGTIDELTFYKNKDGHYIRRKGGISASRIASEKGFQRTRENMAEFGMVAGAVKLLRRTLNTLLSEVTDTRSTTRLSQLFHLVKSYDLTSLRGERQVYNGLQNPEGVKQLQYFEFNKYSTLSEAVKAKYTVDMGSGVIDFPSLNPLIDLKAPVGSTHVTFKSALTRINFATGETDIQYSTPVTLALNAAPTNVNLTIPALPAANGGTLLALLGVTYSQEQNGTMYPMGNAANAMSIVNAEA